MKALLLREYKKLEMTEMPVPQIGPDELLVRVQACGICGSDVHGYDGSTGRRVPPIVMGHEASGVVEAVGGAATRFKPGARITFDSTVYCGRCHFCRRGQVNLCDNRRVLGVSCGDYRQHGCFAEYVAVPEAICYALPENLSFTHAAMIEPVSIAVHGVSRARPEMGDTAVVVGTGMIGLLVVQALRVAGAGRVIAVDLEDRKLQLARELGADEILNANDPEVARKIMAITGRGADLAVECVGATGPINTAIASLSKGGRLVLVGNISPKAEIPLQALVTRELTVLGSCASCGEYPVCIDLLAQGRIRVEPILSATASLDEGPKWFERLYAREAGLMKVVLRP
ncbi:MAG: galactitol-1-phosphate 5-dehydrogenase [Tepidisphaerales bacterium]